MTGKETVKPKVKSYRDLLVYKKSYKLAVAVFRLSAKFPADEKYSLTDQMRRAARSIPMNIAEGWAKRRYENIFKRHLIDSIGSCEETKVCLEFAWDCEYISKSIYELYLGEYDEVGKMLNSLHECWVTY